MQAFSHRYFVSYAMQSGFGCTEVSLPLPIRGIADIKAISDMLAKQVGGDADRPVLRAFRNVREPPGRDR